MQENTTMRKKILQEIHPLSIIREVQKWPVLYEKDSPDRANVHFKNKIWQEVAKELFEDWETCNDATKERRVVDLTKKWRNLRDTFKRHVEAERKCRAGRDVKRRTYVYFKYMLFLLPHVAADEPADAAPTPAHAHAHAHAPQIDDYFAVNRKHLKSDKRKAVLEYDAPRPKTSRHEDAIDEDKHFLLSLVPTFKKMTDDEKLMAKMEILKVVREIRNKASALELSTTTVDTLAYAPESSESVKVEVLRADTDDDTADSDQGSD